MWLVLVYNGSGVLMYAYAFSTQAAAEVAQEELGEAVCMQQWRSEIFQAPALDTALALPGNTPL